MSARTTLVGRLGPGVRRHGSNAARGAGHRCSGRRDRRAGHADRAGHRRRRSGGRLRQPPEVRRRDHQPDPGHGRRSEHADHHRHDDQHRAGRTGRPVLPRPARGGAAVGCAGARRDRESVRAPGPGTQHVHRHHRVAGRRRLRPVRLHHLADRDRRAGRRQTGGLPGDGERQRRGDVAGRPAGGADRGTAPAARGDERTDDRVTERLDRGRTGRHRGAGRHSDTLQFRLARRRRTAPGRRRGLPQRRPAVGDLAGRSAGDPAGRVDRRRNPGPAARCAHPGAGSAAARRARSDDRSVPGGGHTRYGPAAGHRDRPGPRSGEPRADDRTGRIHRPDGAGHLDPGHPRIDGGWRTAGGRHPGGRSPEPASKLPRPTWHGCTRWPPPIRWCCCPTATPTWSPSCARA